MSAERKLRGLLFKTKTTEQVEHISPTSTSRRKRSEKKSSTIKESTDDLTRRTTSKYKNSGRIFEIADIEQKIVAWIQSQREQSVSSTAIRKYALELINPILPGFKASKGWLARFKSRHFMKYAPHTIDGKQKWKNLKAARIYQNTSIPPELEQEIVDLVNMHREPLSDIEIRNYALELIKPIKPGFKASRGWLRRFRGRHLKLKLHKPVDAQLLVFHKN